MLRRAANIYRTVDLESAPKSQILERLFDRFDRDVATARTAITARDIKAKAAALDHAMQIVIQLEAALDRSAAPALCQNLIALYHFVTGKLSTANLKMTVKPLDEAARVMTHLGDAFRAANQVAR